MAGENSVKPKGFKARIENFWYYYKFHTIVVFVALVALSVSLVQCSTKPKYDFQLVLATGSSELAPKQIELFEQEISKLAKDVNGDGLVTVDVIDCTYDEQNSSYQTILGKRQKLQNIMMNEQKMLIFLTDKTCYDWLNTIREDGFMEDLSLSEEDGRRFDLTESAFYENVKKGGHQGLKWPENLYISRRIVAGTLIEKDKKVEGIKKDCDELLNNIIEQSK